ncbi:probable tRNA-splicing endonuclease subunit sen-15 [Aspergillus terreus]|uniref:Probable tRNA-splicing endonuclease subunit sen-15 n=1 Tax=Aspergillus terreus TaxID=33178 RepID=A0A5M3Z166_ASPTE|nr:hypothetical protein ATETN484_0005031000 [Aspergillus terreus]GFF16975.1 probable tRNA-splicing endonuclease subunit sen-15 [Aspergillus terreus]
MTTTTTPSNMTPEPSALTSLIASTSTPSSPYSARTLQILHNLQHQHLWTSLQVHELHLPSINPSSDTTAEPSPGTQSPAPHLLISGIPPNRVYTHPDEQLYMLEKGLREEDIELERVFVLPTVQGQSWSLRKMAAVFNSLPSVEDGTQLQAGDDVEEDTQDKSAEKAAAVAEYYERRKQALQTKEWGGKRMLLAMIDKGMGGDGTIVYYVVQEGAVKPRQN